MLAQFQESVYISLTALQHLIIRKMYNNYSWTYNVAAT